jgi:serine/threonine-protein kinase
MELVEGITLKRFIERKGKLDIKEAVGIGIQIAQGMEAAHDNHIIHRDIKPQNIIISRDGKVKVTDFGIAKATNSNTITSNAMGSVHYLSPEQARGGYSDEKSDIYSLGVTLYEMLSGKVPFAGDNTVSVALLHIQGEAMPLRELDPEIPVSVDKIVQKCMQKRPERRYHSASELIADLKRAISNPDGDFVQIPAFVSSDSPTINISDDLGKIKSGVYLDEELRDTRSLQTKKLTEDEDEDLDTVDSKVEKMFMVGSIVAIVILAVLIVGSVIWFISTRSGKKDPAEDPGIEVSVSPSPELTGVPTPGPDAVVYEVPDVLGLTKEDAEASIKALAAKADVRYTEEYSDTIEEGKVMQQYPQAGNEVEESSVVLLTISLGPEAFEIPNVYGLTEEQADKKLKELGLKLKHEYVASDDIELGRVIETNPARQTTVKSGDTVTVMVSSGSENKKVTVPDLIGLTEKAATSALTKAGLVKGKVTYENSDTYEKGKVTYQSNTAGQKVDSGTIIDIIVSSGLKKENQLYSGSAVIDVNPFENIDNEDADIVLEMEQDGNLTSIFEGPLSSSDFPYTATAVSDSSSVGTIRMYVDGALYIAPGDTEGTTWTIEFTPVEE